MIDRGSGEVRRGLEQPELLVTWPARRSAIHRERAEDRLVRGPDGYRPAGPHPGGHSRFAQDIPWRIAMADDVGVDHRLAAPHRGAIGAAGRVNWLALDPLGVLVGKARRSS